MSEDEIEAVALIIGSAIVRRFAAALRQDGASDEEAVDALALLAGGVAVPVLRTFLSEDDPIAALDQIDELERAMQE